MQIGHGVHQKIKVLQVLSLVLRRNLFLGTIRIRFVTLNSVEVEYMATSQAICEAIWKRKILVGLFSQEMDLILIYCNN